MEMEFNEDLLDWLNESNGYFMPLDSILSKDDEINMNDVEILDRGEAKKNKVGGKSRRKKFPEGEYDRIMPERKRMQNRASSAKYRARKKSEQEQEFNNMKTEIETLRAENERLSRELECSNCPEMRRSLCENFEMLSNVQDELKELKIDFNAPEGEICGKLKDLRSKNQRARELRQSVLQTLLEKAIQVSKPFKLEEAFSNKWYDIDSFITKLSESSIGSENSIAIVDDMTPERMQEFNNRLHKAITANEEKDYDSFVSNEVTRVLIDALEISKANYKGKAEIFGILEEFLSPIQVIKLMHSLMVSSDGFDISSNTSENDFTESELSSKTSSRPTTFDEMMTMK